MKKTAIVIGATGLVGTALLQLLCEQDSYESIKVIARKKGFENPKIEYFLTDFEKMDDFSDKWLADDAYCCLGTTLRQAGSKANFYTVDFRYVLHFAQILSKNKAKKFLLVSSLGAKTNSMFYYSRTKAQAENAVKQLKFEAIHIFRPSLLLGQRKEKRFGEDVAKRIDRLFSFMLPKRYKGIEAETVAKAMLKAATKNQNGIYIHEADKIVDLANGL